MPTLEYKIRKLAEILEEQGIYLDDFTLSYEAWQTWLEEHNAIDPSVEEGAWFIRVGDRKIRVNRRGRNEAVPLEIMNAPGQQLGPMPVPAIAPHPFQALEQQRLQA